MVASPNIKYEMESEVVPHVYKEKSTVCWWIDCWTRNYEQVEWILKKYRRNLSIIQKLLGMTLNKERKWWHKR